MNGKEKVLFSAWFLKFYCDMAGCDDCPLRTHNYRCILYTQPRRKPFRWSLPEYKGPPITDVTAVVHCSECKNFKPFPDGKYGNCMSFPCKDCVMKPTDYCSYGESKESEDKSNE